MATFHGKDGVVKIGANAVASVQSWSYSEDVELVDKSSMGDSAKSYLSGMTDGGGSIECLFDPDDSNGQGAFVVDTSIALNLYPEGDTPPAGQVSFTGNVNVSAIEYTGNKDGAPSATFTFKGQLTKGTVS